MDSTKMAFIKLIIFYITLFISLSSQAITPDLYNTCKHDEVDQSNMIPSNFFTTYTVKYGSQKFQSSKALPIRISYEVGDIPETSNGIKNDYIFSLFEALIIYMHHFIKVVPRSGPIKNVSSKTQCNTYTYPLYFSSTGVSNSDFHIFVSPINEPQADSSPFNAWWCELDPNPVAAVVQINYAKISKNHPLPQGFQRNFQSLLHQFVHVLGFSYKLLPYWIDYSTKQPYGSAVSKILQKDYIFGANSQTLFLKSFNVKYFANNYYDCSNAEGLNFENQASINTSVSHWEFDMTGNELMVQNTFLYQLVQLSQMTISLLRDTGFYDSINTNMVASSFWGKNERCEFMEKNCRSTSYTYNEFNDQVGYQCDFYQIGFVNPSVPSPNSECSMAILDVTNLCENDSDHPQDAINRMNTGVTSRCFKSNAYQTIGGSITNNVKCFKAECSPLATTITITIWGSEKVYCNYADESINLDSNGMGTSGYLKCPSNFQQFCSYSQLICKNNCSNHGFCNKGTCFCLQGYAGEDCSVQCASNQAYDTPSCVSNCGAKFRTPSNTCSSTCPQGFYGDSTSKMCLICHPFCQACTGPLSTQCSSCNFPYLLTGNTCTDRKCHASCETCYGLGDENCLSCFKGQFLNSSNKCQACDSACTECEGGADICIDCPTTANYFYVYDPTAKQCVSSCHSSCLTCSIPYSDTSCLSCPEGYFLKSGQCLICQSPCKTCVTSKNQCLSCITGYDYKSSICTPICDPTCKSCFRPGPGECMQCYDGYYYATGYCLQCQSPCKTCIGKKTACLSCVDGYKLGPLSCSMICDSSCLTCTQPLMPNACKTCRPGYYLTDLNTCEICQSPCKQCIDTSTKCTECIDGFELDINQPNTCKIKCDEACETCLVPNDSTQCLKCAKEYQSAQSQSPFTCVKCPSPCLQCVPGTSICSNCQDGFELVNNQCQISCHPSCQACSEPYNSFACSSCSEGYYLQGTKCIECQSPCKTCVDSSTNCTQCIQNYKVMGSKCIFGCHYSCLSCVQNDDENSCVKCQSGFYFEQIGVQQNSIVGQCISCQSNCERCEKIIENGTTIKKCLECKSGYEFDVKGNCALCHQSCETCFKPSDSKSCLTCYSPLNLSKSNECVKCEIGQYFSKTESICSVCPNNCKACSNDKKCDTCNDGYEIDENYQCIKSMQCHYSCQECANSSYSSCSMCSEQRQLKVLNEQLQLGVCDCPSGTTDVGVALCQNSSLQKIISQTSQLTFMASASVISLTCNILNFQLILFIYFFIQTVIAIISLNPISFLIMIEFCQSLSYLSYVNYKPAMGLDEVMNTVSYVHLSKLYIFNNLFDPDSDNTKNGQRQLVDDAQESSHSEDVSEEENAKFQMNDKSHSFIENSILIIGINFITWILSGYFSLLKVSKKSSFLLKVKRLFCISAPIAIFSISSQEYSLLIFLQLRTLEYDTTFEILNLVFALLSLVYIASMLFYLTFQLEYTRKVQRQKRFNIDTENNRSQRNDLSQARSKNDLTHKNSRQDLSHYVPSRNELSTQKITYYKPSQQSQVELSRNHPSQQEYENKSSVSNDKSSSNEQPSPQNERVPQYKIHLYLIYKYVKQDNVMTRNFIQITIIRKLIISISCVAVTIHPIAQISVQLLGYILYSIYLLITKPLKYPKQMLMVCIIDSVITLMHIIYIIMIAYSDDSFIQKLMSMIILFMTISVFVLYFVYSIYILVKLFYLQVQKCIHRNSQIRYKAEQAKQKAIVQEKKDETIIQMNNQDIIDQARSPNCTIVFSSSKFISQQNQISPKYSPKDNDNS